MKIPPIYCVMTGFNKPISKETCEILFINAYDMIQNTRRQQSIKGKGYEGVIRTNLKELTWGGFTVIIFDAYVLVENMNEAAEIRYAVRPSDVDPELFLQHSMWGSFRHHDELSIEEIIEYIQESYSQIQNDEEDEDEDESSI